uniref:Uncharacterized protein n=1 Tax=Rhodopseudomonas palustris (strain DX-1) TaxID=652103 RepID=E6VPE3_RHOPX
MGPNSSRMRIATPLACLLAIAVGLSAVYAIPLIHPADPPLQRLADEAALQGVTALAASAAVSQERSTAVSTAAARRVLGDRELTVQASKPSADELEVSVEVTDPATRQRVRSSARYLPPSSGRIDQQSAAIGRRSGPPAHL